ETAQFAPDRCRTFSKQVWGESAFNEPRAIGISVVRQRGANTIGEAFAVTDDVQQTGRKEAAAQDGGRQIERLVIRIFVDRKRWSCRACGPFQSARRRRLPPRWLWESGGR